MMRQPLNDSGARIREGLDSRCGARILPLDTAPLNNITTCIDCGDHYRPRQPWYLRCDQCFHLTHLYHAITAYRAANLRPVSGLLARGRKS